MKLSTKTLLYYAFIGLPLLIIAVVISYYLIKSELKDGVDEALVNEKTHTKKIITSFKQPQTVYLSADSLSFIKPVNTKKNDIIFTDSVYQNGLDNELVRVRLLRSYFLDGNVWYEIQLAKTTFEEEELMEGLLSSFVIILISLSITVFFVQWFVSKTLWKPFYQTLSILGKYDVKQHQRQKFNNENIIEFQQLNSALTLMTDKLTNDYLQQKEFTENASHEMQTPLAVIKTQLGLLMQSPHLSETEMNQLQVIENTTKKMSSINKALILLSKIGNNQFEAIAPINLQKLLTKIIEQYQDLLDVKNITLTIECTENATIQMNVSLAEILISNLFRNAINHNITNGTIHIKVLKNSFSISNSGIPLTINSKELFIRFKKNDTSQDSLGLGLSIVQSICNSCHFNINYSYSNNLHIFILNF